MGQGLNQRQKQYELKKINNVLANKTRRLVFKAAFTAPGMAGMRIQKVPWKRAGWPGTGKASAAGEKPPAQAGSRPAGLKQVV